MKKILFLIALFFTAAASAQVIKPDLTRSPNGPNTIVDWNVKFKTMIIPHGNTFTLAGAQDSTGHLRLRVAGDTTVAIYIKGYGWLQFANKRDINAATAFGYGLTVTGHTLKVDSSLIQTILNFYPKGDIRYIRKSDSTHYITPWQLLHRNNTITGIWDFINQENQFTGVFTTRSVGGHTSSFDGTRWTSNDAIGIFPGGTGYVAVFGGLRTTGIPTVPTDVMTKSYTDSLFTLKGDTPPYITPNLFSGSDIVRIRKAIDSANTTTHVIHIPNINSRDGGVTWLIDSTILIPSKMTVYIDGAKIKLSDQSRDNFFRSSNVGYGITSPSSVSNIAVIGTGNAVLEGADNPRATGDGSKTLSLTTNIGTQTLSYGSDAAVPAEKQTGDWRNYGIVLGYVNGVTIKGLTMRKTHGWAIDLERCDDVNVTDIILNNDQISTYNSTSQIIRNRDGVNLVFGARRGYINNITGRSGDDGLAYAMSADSTRGNPGEYASVVTGFQFVASRDTIRDVNTSNVNLYSGLGSVMALRPGEGTWRRMFNMNFDNITDSGLPADYIHTTGAVFLLGRYTASMGTNNPASFKNISFSNIKNNLLPYAFNVVGTMSNSTITGAIKSNAGSFFNYTAGNGGLYNVQVNNSQDQTSVYNNWLVTGNAGTSEQSIKISKTDSVFSVKDTRTHKSMQLDASITDFTDSKSIMSKAAVAALGYLTSYTETDPIYIANGVALAGSQTITGQKTLTNSMISNLAANTNRVIYQSGGVNRWILLLSGTESTGDLGSDYAILRRHDDGTAFGTALSISRATGALQLPAYGTGIMHSSSGGALTSSAVNLAGADITGILAGVNGGTGVNNSGKTITLGGNLTTSGAFATTFTTTATTNVTLPTTGTLMANPMTTQGDIIIGGASGTAARLALSAAGNFPVSNGTTIVNTAFSSLGVADFIYWNGTNWANRSMTVTGFRTWNNSTATLSNANHFIFTPTTGGTVTLLNNQENIINPAGALVALTLALPASPANNDRIPITFTQSITNISYTGGTVVGGLTTIAQGGQYYLTYDTVNATWY